jgi:hypothetical protein
MQVALETVGAVLYLEGSIINPSVYFFNIFPDRHGAREEDGR